VTQSKADDFAEGVICASADQATCELLLETLTDMGQNVFPAVDGPSVVALASRMRATLIVLDIHLRGLDGVRACARIRSLPGHTRTPIVMLTQNDTERVQAVAAGAGATMFIARPFGPVKLACALAKFLNCDDLASNDDGTPGAQCHPKTLCQISDTDMAGSVQAVLKRPAALATPARSGVVLVADDDSLIRSILRSKLEALNQDVVLANNGQEAVELASKMRATLIVLDIVMPKLGGIAACEQIRKMPGYRDVPIVILTFNGSAEAITGASRAGATAFLTKPFGSAALLLALSEYLSISSAMREMIYADAVKAAGGRSFGRPSLPPT